MKQKKSLLSIIVVIIVAVLGFYLKGGHPTTTSNNSNGNSTTQVQSGDTSKGNQTIVSSFKSKKSDVWVTGSGKVTRLLASDTDGAAHQKFVVKIDGTNQTIQIVHNTDIAPQVKNLNVGDTVEFHGEYYYNAQGGGVHWTHHDPDGSSEGGWLKVNGKVYK